MTQARLSPPPVLNVIPTFQAYLHRITHDIADMLEVGVGEMTYEESKSHFSLWAMMAAPLILGNDLRSMTAQTLQIISNAEVIAVDQDALGLQGRRVVQGIESDIYAKPLTGGVIAVALWNKVNYPLDITLNWADLGTSSSTPLAIIASTNSFSGLAPNRTLLIRDLWQHAELGSWVRSYTAKSVPGTGIVVLTLAAPKTDPPLHSLVPLLR